ncbi:High-affinity nickel-transport family protein [Senna tora]|uniref:High-affinity nickel-transport family protein n=1 Tax=Senna tora TaxID=362788 RepID=A0A834SVW1_9FABA|nr:High-affinity nickel-transport family protein [Senna tora]
MDRLLSSSSPTSLKINLNPSTSTFLHRKFGFDSPRFIFPTSTRSNLRWPKSISSKHDRISSLSSTSPSFTSSVSPNHLPSLSPSSDRSAPEFRVQNQITNGDFGKRKSPASAPFEWLYIGTCVFSALVAFSLQYDWCYSKAITARTCAILSALVMILLQPAFAPAAYATFQTAAKAGGPAVAAVGGKLIRTELLSSAWTGFFAGCLHTLSGPDHLAALAPLSIGRTRMESAAVGALWGCGHDAGQVIFGLIFLLLKDQLHIEVIRTWGTRVVGLTLLVIGAMGIKEVSEVPTPCVALENGECDVSVYESLDNPTVGKKKIGFATFATGIVHGLQPDALMMVLPALALPSRLAGAAFLIMFLLGTVFAMGSYTVFIGSCSQALKDRIPRITEKLTWASSLVAIALGFAIIISQFFGFSLY